MNRIIGVILIIVIICGMFTGCYDRREIDDMTYVMAIGLDRGKTNVLRLTLQYAVPKAIGGGEGGGGGGKPLETVVVETPSLYAGLNMLNNSLGKQVNLSHAKVIVFSKELAADREGVTKYVHSFARGREFRPNIFIAVARESAEDYIKEVKPIQEVDPSKYYELNYAAYTYTGFAANAQFHKFYTEAESFMQQSVAALTGVSRYESPKDFDINDSTYKEKGRPFPLEGDFKAGMIPKSGDIKAEKMGLAVFNGGRMVGELDGQEAIDYLMVTGEYNYSYVTIPDPLVKDKLIILNVKQSRKPVRRVEMVNGKPSAYVKVVLEADILGFQSNISYEEGGNLRLVEEATERLYKEDIERFLNRTSKEFESDICGFGKSIKKNFLTVKEMKDFAWLSRYKDSTFEVEVDLKIRRPGLIIRTQPIMSSTGEER